MNKKIILTSFIILLVNSFYAQDADENYTPKGGVFGASFKKRTSSAYEISNSVSFNPALLLRSTTALFYERKIGSSETVKAGIGFATNYDRYLFTIADGMDYFEYDGYSLTYLSKNSKLNSGLFMYLSFKYYYDDLMDGSYVEINYRRNSYNSTAVISDLTANGSKDFSVIANSFYLNWGRHITSGGSLKLTHDFYIGFGLRIVQMNEMNVDYSNNTYRFSNEMVDIGMAPALVAGYAIGFGF
jgi:hypothetical protein